MTNTPAMVLQATSVRWQSLNAPILGTDDSYLWNRPPYYETIKLADVNGDGQAELLARGQSGLLTYTFDRGSGRWTNLNAGDLGLTDAAGWGNPQYYSTLRLADIDGDGQAELLIRGSAGLGTYHFDRATNTWASVAAGNLGINDDNGWGNPQYYSTLQLADINGDGQAELLIRGFSGLSTYAFDRTANAWVDVHAGLLGLSDSAWWDRPEYYSTIQTADINGDGQSELIARTFAGIDGWSYTQPADLAALFLAERDDPSSYGYEISCSLEPDPSLPDGTFALRMLTQVPNHFFTCMLFNSQGCQVGEVKVLPSTASSEPSPPLPLASLPGRLFTAHLNYRNSQQPDLVFPILVPEALATLANRQWLTFIWSKAPTTWPDLTKILNNTVALDFDGTTAYLNIGTSNQLEQTGKASNLITMQSWIKPTASDGSRAIISARTPTGEVYLRIANGQYQVGSWTGQDHMAACAMPLSDLGRWVHLCGVYDGTQWTLYRNGLAVTSTRDTTGVIGVTGSQPAASWAIGAQGAIGTQGGGGKNFFRGRLRGIALWKTARTGQQVKDDMLTHPAAAQPGLAAYWALDEGKRDAYDTTNSLSANVVGAKWISPLSIDPLMRLAPRALPDFSPSQTKIYGTIRAQLNQGDPIRETYSNYVYSGQWTIWQGKLTNDKAPLGSIPLTDWTSADWTAVRNILADEMANVGKVWLLFEHTVQLLTAMQQNQVEDLNDVVSTLKSTLPTNPAAGNAIDWSPWVFTIASDALGVLSYVPESQVAQIGLCIGSDLVSALSSLQPTGGSASPPPIDDTNLPQQIRDQIHAAYKSLLRLASDRFTRIIQDARLLPIVGRLAATTWDWNPDDLTNLLGQIRSYNKIGSYQQLIGSLYQISEWVNYPLPAPALTLLPDLMGAPFYAYWVVPSPQGNGLHNIYIIHTPANSWGDTDWKVSFSHVDRMTIISEPQGVPGFSKPMDATLYPSQDVIDDLFGQLSVSRTDFFNCTNGWENIPLNLWTGLLHGFSDTESLGDSV